MKEINDEIYLTISMMQSDLYEDMLDELRNHIVCLLEIKRNVLQRHLDEYPHAEPAKPLTYLELDAGGWWCGDVSEACRLAFIANGVHTEAEHWEYNPRIRCAYKLKSNVLILRAHIPIDVSTLKQIYRIGGNFYWSEK